MYPRWCVDALRSVGVDLLADSDSSEGGEGKGVDGKKKRKKLVVDGSGAKWEYSKSTDGPEGYIYTAAAATMTA